jgi:O-succinylbenzoic acid--CoA ligase
MATQRPALFLDPATPQRWPVFQTPYEAEALDFCRAWVSGQSEFVLQTSGSTGVPKAITLTRAQMRASAHLTGQTLGLKPGDAALVCLNVRYVAGVMMLVRGLELSLPMTIIEPSGNPLANFDPRKIRFAFMAFVPLQLQTVLEQASDKLPILNGMKAILVGGAATSPALEQALQVIESPVFATYGMTETLSHIALRRLNGTERRDWFTALDGVDLGTDERGCLHITSVATNFVRVQTNDVVELSDPTHFRLLGRADRIINSGGVKVQPEQIEQIIENVLATAGVRGRLFVAGLPSERLGQRVVLFCEAWTPTDEQWQRIQDAVRTQMGPYAVPKKAITVAQFSETPTGKMDRVRTIDQYR